MQSDPPGEALRRLIGQVERTPLPAREDHESHFFEVKERFMILRRLGVESLCLAHQARRVDSFLLLEIGALTTNRLIALLEALPTGRISRKGFFDLMRFEVEFHREKDATWKERTRGLKSLIVAQSKLDRLERSVPLAATAERNPGTIRRCAVGCAVYIAFFLEAWRRQEQGQDV